MKQFAQDRETVIDRFFASGGELLLNASFDMEAARRARDLAERYENIYFMAGIHPHDAHVLSEDETSELEQLLRHAKCVALGEIGLDYYRNFTPRDVQQEMFAQLLQLASSRQHKIVIHSREAAADVINWVKEHGEDIPGGILHCFAGSGELAEYFLGRGFYISVAGNITYPKAEELRAAVKEYVPLERLLLETDAPYLAPQTRRGKRNEPSYINEFIPVIAELYEVTPAELAAITVQNARDFIKGGKQ